MKTSLNKIKELIEKFVAEKYGRQVDIDIHITTALEKVKANVQGKKRKYDILISGEVKLNRMLIEAVAHEVAHVILKDEKHKHEFEVKMKEIKEWLLSKANL